MNSDTSQLLAEAAAYTPFRDISSGEEIEHQTYYNRTETNDIYESTDFSMSAGGEIYQNEFLTEETDPYTEQEDFFDKFGDVVVKILGLQNLQGYEDPSNSGLPLLYVDDKNRSQSLSKNFTVGEFAQAAKGRYKLKYYRADPDLIKELQILRDVLAKPITIIDGYYPPKYQKEVLRKPLTSNPHFSGRGVKISAAGVSPKTLAENIIIYCDSSLSVSVGDDSVAFYIKQKLPRVTSYIRDPKKKAAVIKELEDLDKKVQGSVIKVVDVTYEDIPKALVSLASPVNDFTITGPRLKEAGNMVDAVIELMDKFMLGKSDTDQAVTYIKSTKNFVKLSEQISNLSGGKDLAEQIKRDNSGLDFRGKLKLLSNSLGIIESIARLSTVTEKKKAYEQFLQNNTAANVYFAVDVIEGVGKLATDTVGLGLSIATVLAADAGTKARLLETAAKIEKISKGFSVFIEGVKIVRSIVNIIILVSEGKYSEIKDHLIDIGKSIATIAATLKFGTGFLALATGIYLFYKFILVTLPTMVGDNVRAIAMGSTIIALRELNQEFERITRAYLHVNYNYERILRLTGNDELKLASNPNLARRAYFDFTWFHRELESFSKYVRELDYTTRSKMGYYKSFPSIPARIFSKNARFKIDSVNIILKDYPKKSADFSFIYADNLNELYQVFYDGIVKCHLEIEQIYNERVKTGWGKDPFNKEIEDTEIEDAEIEMLSSIDNEPDSFAQEYSFESEDTFEPENEVLQDRSVIAPLTKVTIDASKQSGFLSPAANSKASAKNAALISKSGVSTDKLLKALDEAVDLNSLRQVMNQYNQSNPKNSYQLSSANSFDAVFTEAVHQYQVMSFLNTAEHDGILGSSTLETLGFIDHKLRPQLNSSGFYGQQQLNQIKSKVASATGNKYTAANWFNFILRPAWLGVKISSGVHVLLLQKLREAENWLKTQQKYKGMTPAQLGKAMGFSANTAFSAARLSANKEAMHAFGLAVDINGWGNPWVGAGWVENNVELLKERTRFIDVLRKASGQKLPGNAVFAYLHHIAQTSGNDTAAAYDTLKQRSDEFIDYLRNNSSELNYWRNSATFGKRNPLDGFLNLHRDLVYALRQIAGLAWGGLDFGPSASGDLMHFDLRATGVGTIICTQVGGYVPSKGHHPAIQSEEPYAFSESEEDYEVHEAIEEANWV